MKRCPIPTCNYPEGQCAELCVSADEARADIIGQNGPTGEHYQDCPPIPPTLPTDLPTGDDERDDIDVMWFMFWFVIITFFACVAVSL